MKYFFCVRAIPVTPVVKDDKGITFDAVTGERLVPYEIHTPEDVKRLPFNQLRLVLNHNQKEHAVIGKTIAQWPDKDGSLLVIGCIDDSTLAGEIAQRDIQKGLISGASISYEINVYASPDGELHTERNYLELSLTALPDRKDDRCNILFGATESELVLNAGEYIKRLEKSSPNLTISEDQVKGLLAKISSASVKGTEQEDPQHLPSTEMSQTPTTALTTPIQTQPQVPAPTQVPTNPPQNATAPVTPQQQQTGSISEFANRARELYKRDPEALKKSLAGFSAEEMQNALFLFAAGDDQKTSSTLQTPAQTPVQQQPPPSQQDDVKRQIEEDLRRQYEAKIKNLEEEKKRAEDITKKQVIGVYESARDSFLDSLQKILPQDGANKTETVKKDIDLAFRDQINANPQAAQNILPMMKVMNDVVAYGAIHAQQNNDLKLKYLELEKTVGIKRQDDDLRNSLKQALLSSGGPLRSSHYMQRPEPYPSQKMDTSEPYPNAPPSVSHTTFSFGQQSTTVTQPPSNQTPAFGFRELASRISSTMNSPADPVSLRGFSYTPGSVYDAKKGPY